jgi:hypothetical protein
MIDKPIRRRRRRRRRGGNVAFNYNERKALSHQQQQQQQRRSSLTLHQQSLSSFAYLTVEQQKQQQQQNDTIIKDAIDYEASFLKQQSNIPFTFNNKTSSNSPHSTFNLTKSNRNSDADESYSSGCDTDTDSDSTNSHNYQRIERGMVKLTHEEDKLLKSIDEAYKISVDKVSFEPPSKTISTHDVDATINVTEIAVRRFVNFFKLNIDFQSLSQDTQTIILKGSMMELLLINAGITYDVGSKTFHEPCKLNAFHLDVESLRKTYGDEKCGRIMNIARRLSELCEGNFLIIKLMFFLSLFKLENDGITHGDNEIIRSLNIKYTKFLHKYMQSCFKYPASDLKFGMFACMLREINTLGNDFRHLVVESANPDKVHGLMREVFSLPDRNDEAKLHELQLQIQQQRRATRNEFEYSINHDDLKPLYNKKL